MCTDAKNRITLSIINIAAVQLLHLLLGRERNIRTHALMHARTRIHTDTDTHRHRHTQIDTRARAIHYCINNRLNTNRYCTQGLKRVWFCISCDQKTLSTQEYKKVCFKPVIDTYSADAPTTTTFPSIPPPLYSVHTSSGLFLVSHLV